MIRKRKYKVGKLVLQLQGNEIELSDKTESDKCLVLPQKWSTISNRYPIPKLVGQLQNTRITETKMPLKWESLAELNKLTLRSHYHFITKKRQAGQYWIYQGFVFTKQ